VVFRFLFCSGYCRWSLVRCFSCRLCPFLSVFIRLYPFVFVLAKSMRFLLLLLILFLLMYHFRRRRNEASVLFILFLRRITYRHLDFAVIYAVTIVSSGAELSEYSFSSSRRLIPPDLKTLSPPIFDRLKMPNTIKTSESPDHIRP
jgi:signal transduction histidine kinase